MITAWYTLMVPLCGVAIIGALSGVIGTYAFLKKQTMLGDAVSHAALPGIVLMFLCTHSVDPLLLMSGGFITGLLAVICITFLSTHTPLSSDALLGITLSVFFGVGLVLLTHVQKMALSDQSILNKFLFGSAATLLHGDLKILLWSACFIFSILFIFWKEFVLIVFDPHYARSCGYSVRLFEIVLYILMVMAIVSGLYAVGVVLMSSFMVAPAVIARQLTQSVLSMAWCAAMCGAMAGIIGVLISASLPHLPTGPVIVLVATTTAYCFLFFNIKKK